MKQQKTLTLKTLSKGSVWDIQENDVFRLWEAAEKDADLKDNMEHYLDVIRTAFEIEKIQVDRPEVIKKYEARGFKVDTIKADDSKIKIAIKKRPIQRVTDLTYENIRHITAAKLIEVLDRNFGGGWDSLPQKIQDIIEKGFDISTTTLPKDRLHKPGGMYEKKINDGFEVLEIEKGAWVEAIFAKVKPELKKVTASIEDEPHMPHNFSDEDDDFDEEEIDENYDDGNDDEDDDTFDEEKLTEESYRTTFDENPDELNLEAEDISDEEEY
jgi:hypothetical protein